MTEKQLLKADKQVLVISIIIISGIFSSMLGLLYIGGNTVKVVVELVICVLSVIVDIVTYRKLKGTIFMPKLILTSRITAIMIILLICTLTIPLHLMQKQAEQ